LFPAAFHLAVETADVVTRVAKSVGARHPERDHVIAEEVADQYAFPAHIPHDSTGCIIRPMHPLRSVLIAFASRPPIIDYLKAAFARRGIEVKAVFADDNTWFDRFVIHRLNKLAHNFRVIPKSRNFLKTILYRI
jgi:hypothetical protein